MRLEIDGIRIDRIAETVSSIGIDIDNYGNTKKFTEAVQDTEIIAERFGMVYGFRSRKGWHIEIKTERPVTLLRSFEIRYFLRDDFHRLCRDMLKGMHGMRVIDVLFDHKVIHRKSILE